MCFDPARGRSADVCCVLCARVCCVCCERDRTKQGGRDTRELQNQPAFTAVATPIDPVTCAFGNLGKTAQSNSSTTRMSEGTTGAEAPAAYDPAAAAPAPPASGGLPGAGGGMGGGGGRGRGRGRGRGGGGVAIEGIAELDASMGRGAPIPPAGGGGGGKPIPKKEQKDFRGPAGLFKQGDWTCTACGNVNWERRATCNKCNNPKPNLASLEEVGRVGLGWVCLLEIVK